MTRFISILSLKPNTGNTTIALNLGLALHKQGKRVIVLDADFSKPNMIEHLYEKDLPLTLLDVLNNQAHISDIMVRHDSGLRIIPSHMHETKNKNINTSNNYMKLGIHLPELQASNDFVILDLPKQLDAIKELLNYSDEALIVHTPEYSSKYVLDAEKLLINTKTTSLGVIMNKSHENSKNSIFGHPVISVIPNDPLLINSFQLKKPLLHLYPRSKSSKKFFNIANRFI